MTRDHPVDEEITTEDEFDAALGRLLLKAAQNDIDPRGARVYRNGEMVPDWEVMVFELEKAGATD